jgi:16S rRNA A1518/A1519 N6-dimethyltransferase RsmA/KsgA/DIM1 with predicted DNA glycosylase/AP lyase activity
MKKKPARKQADYELREEYDLAKITVLPKGRFDPKHRIGSNVVVLEPEIAKAFPDDKSVNEALRLILKATKIPQQTAVTR